MGKKPDISKFREVLHKTGGNLSKVAAVFNVTRKTVYDWARADSQFKDAITDERGSLVDEFLYLHVYLRLVSLRKMKMGTLSDGVNVLMGI